MNNSTKRGLILELEKDLKRRSATNACHTMEDLISHLQTFSPSTPNAEISALVHDYKRRELINHFKKQQPEMSVRHIEAMVDNFMAERMSNN